MERKEENLVQFAALQAKNVTEKKRNVIEIKRQLKVAEDELFKAESSMFAAVDRVESVRKP
jgi:hypothetical protein